MTTITDSENLRQFKSRLDCLADTGFYLTDRAQIHMLWYRPEWLMVNGCF